VAGRPAAFMSYSHFDDEHDRGRLSEFRAQLAGEVRAQTGQPFEIFQDRTDIAWGQNWRRRIEETLDAVTLLLVILTPGFFRSDACRGEVTRFLKREKELGRSDLILPVYYITSPEMNDPSSDELAKVLASRQYANWRKLRLKPITSPEVLEAIAELAEQMAEAFEQRGHGPARSAAVQNRQAPRARERPGSTGQATARTEQPVHIVDPWPGRGDFTSVSAAIEEAKPGDKIVVRPGVYAEGLMMDKPLEIVGDGPVDEILIQARGMHALAFRTEVGRVANMTLRQVGGVGNWYAVDVSQGRLKLEGCDISSRGGVCIVIRDGADPQLRRNTIHDGKQSGVYIGNDGRGTLEDNDIAGNGTSGVEMSSEGNPTLRRNKIHHNREHGVCAYFGGLGMLEDNDIIGNRQSGVHTYNAANLTVRHNRINGNGYAAVWIDEGGRGVFEDNDLTGNQRGPWDIAADCEDNVTRTGNIE
jgi:parallel beta-helix repeat protein